MTVSSIKQRGTGAVSCFPVVSLETLVCFSCPATAEFALKSSIFFYIHLDTDFRSNLVYTISAKLLGQVYKTHMKFV